MKQDRQKTNWLIDAGLFAGFIGSIWLDLTGVAVHQWLGLAVAVFAGYHLWKHWAWVKAVSGRFFTNTSGRSRAYYLVDAGLAAGFAAITTTGLVISTWLDLALAYYAAWHAVHIVASVATLALLIVKIGLHWRWIVDVARRRVLGTAPRPGSEAGAPVARTATVTLGRREFVRLMAGVGAVAVLSGANALGAVTVDGVSAAAPTAPTQSAAPTAQASTSVAASSSCQVRCGKRCSYPGQCRKYIDSNGNGRCDLGECAS